MPDGSDASHSLPPILIADDEPDDLFFARRRLQRAGLEHPVVCVEDGEDAIQFLSGCILAQRLPCLIRLDIRMPRRTGFEVLAWARRQRMLSEVAIVMISSSGLEEDRARANELGATGDFVKFPTIEDLGGVLKQHCARAARLPTSPKPDQH